MHLLVFAPCQVALIIHVLNLIQNLSHPSLTLGLRDQFPSCCDHHQHHQHLLSNQIMILSCHLLSKKGQRKFSFLAKRLQIKSREEFCAVYIFFFVQLPQISGAKMLHNWENFVNISPKICCLTFISNQCVGQLTSRLFHEKQGPAEPGVNCF